MSRKNGGIIGPANTPVGGLITGLAGGVWRMNDVANFVGNSQWPKAPENIDNSLRFNSGSNDTLKKTFNASNRDTITLSAWVKRCKFGTSGDLLKAGTSNGTNNDNISYVAFDTSDRLRVEGEVSGSAIFKLRTTRKFRDSSAWYHICVAIDSTQATASNRIKVYVNGVQETVFDNEDYMSQNTDTFFNSAEVHSIGGANTSGNFDGYMAEFCFIDGTALDPTSFGEFDTATGIWKPKKIGQIANAGTNSFYLDFKDSSNVGNDASGLNNDFTVNNLTSIDQATDTCVVNFATLNPIAFENAASPLSEGNLRFDGASSGAHNLGIGTIAVDQGKWWFEAELDAAGGSYPQIGIRSVDVNNSLGQYVGQITGGAGYFQSGGIAVDGSNVVAAGGVATYTDGDIINVGLDLDNNKIYWYKNGTIVNSGGTTITNRLYTFAVSQYQNTGHWFCNFGAGTIYSISSGNADANGFGNFEHAPPSGYYALNTSNLNTYG